MQMKIKLINNLTKVEYDLPVSDNKVSAKYWNFNLTLPDGIQDGEYSYQVYDDDNISIASGLAQIGDYTPIKTEYNEKEEYITYDE